MSTALVQQAAAGGLTAFTDLSNPNNPFANLGNEYGVPVGDFLKFDGNTGKYTHKGQPIDESTVLAFNVMQMQRGWVCWKDGKLVEKIMRPVASGERPPRLDELPDHGPYDKEGDGWRESIMVPVRDLDGGSQMEFSGTSRSAVNALARLAMDFGQKVRMHIDSNGIPKVPLVEIGAQGFTSKKFPGTKYAPTFQIVDWMSEQELQEMVEEALGGEDASPSEEAGAAVAAVAATQQTPDAEQAKGVPVDEAPKNTSYRRGRVGNRRV